MKIKKIGVFKVIFTCRFGEVSYVTSVIVVTGCNHIRFAFNNAFKPFKHSVPLNFVLTVVTVVAGSENKFAFGMLF